MERFEEYSASQAFIHHVEQWNDVVALTVMTEPVRSQRVFQRLTVRLDYDELGFELREVASLDAEERTDLMMDLVIQHISEHRVMVSKLYRPRIPSVQSCLKRMSWGSAGRAEGSRRTFTVPIAFWTETREPASSS